jgi:D-alanyl-D-alanine dipeptidase
MSEDPKLFDAGDYNLYRYCHNDPLDFTDPMGLEIPGVEPPPTLGKQVQNLQAKARDVAERSQSTYEAAHTPNAAASLRQRYVEINQQKLSLLGSVFRAMASSFIGSANAMLNPEGYEVKIADQGGYRSFEEQARLRAYYEATGKNKANRPGESAHNYGAAIDIDIIKGSRANEEIGLRAYNSLSGRLGALGESQGLIWGGRFNDPPHFQHPGIPVNGPEMLRLHQQLLRTTGAGLDALMGVP